MGSTMRVERVDIRVLLVRDDLEPMGAGLVREGVTSGPVGRPDEVVAATSRPNSASREPR